MSIKDKLSSFKKKIRKWLVYSLLVLFVVGLGYYIIGGMTYSEGTRSGVLTKVSKKGYIFKTYEGQLAISGVGGYVMNPGEQGNVWSFSTRDELVYRELQKYEGRPITLSYKETYRTFYWWGETRYFVTGADPIDREELEERLLIETDSQAD